MEQARTDGQQAVEERDRAAARFRHLVGAGFVEDAWLATEPTEPATTTAALEAARAVAEELSSVPYEPRNIKDAHHNLSQAMYATQQVLAGRVDLELEPDGDVDVLVATVDGAGRGRRGSTSRSVTTSRRPADGLPTTSRSCSTAPSPATRVATSPTASASPRASRTR
ncbi:MAG: hypothetical protein ACRDN9_16490 [Streptosporangiaceae bacterium]